MEHHDSFITSLLNHWFGESFSRLLAALGIEGVDPHHAFPDTFVMGAVAILIAAALVLWLKPRLSVERPGMFQQICEWLLTNPLRIGIQDVLDDNVHHHGRQYTAMVGTVGIFVLLCNLISLIPGFTSPTAQISAPLACALVTYIHFNWSGARRLGMGKYLSHFAGPVWWLSWLIFPVEVISATARILSLTVRLWANIFASELIYTIFLSMLLLPTQFAWEKLPVAGVVIGVFPAAIPILFLALHMFVAVVQAFVFTILPAVYLGMATAEEH